MSSSWIGTGPESNDQCVLPGDRSHGCGRGPVTHHKFRGAEVATRSQERPGVHSPPEPRQGANPATTLIWDPVLWYSERIHFWSLKPPGWWSFVTAEPGSGPIPSPEKASFAPEGH